MSHCLRGRLATSASTRHSVRRTSPLPTPTLETYTAHSTAAPAVQSNEVYLTPCTTVPPISFAWASDKHYSLAGMRSLFQSFAEFLQALRDGPAPAVEGIHCSDAAGKFIVTSRVAETVFHTRRRVVMRGRRVIAKFSDIQAVDIRAIRDEDRPKSWSVSLRTSFIGAINIGNTFDDVEASILGARLSEVLGVQVVA